MRTEPSLRSDHRLEPTIPPALGPRPSRPMVALAAVTTLFVVAAGIALWTSTELAQRNDEITAIREERDAAVAEVTSATERLAAITARVARLEGRLETVEGDERALAAKLADARATLQRMLGPALPDGEAFGYLVAVGARQDPPRLVFDMAQWFTDQAAVDAAIADGVLPEGSTMIENGYYIRNDDPRWRVVEVAPTTTVSLVVWPFGQIESPLTVTFVRFEDLFRRNPEVAIRAFPYRLTVEGGTVTGIEQQFIP